MRNFVLKTLQENGEFDLYLIESPLTIAFSGYSVEGSAVRNGAAHRWYIGFAEDEQ